MLPTMTKVPGYMNDSYMRKLLAQGRNKSDGRTNRNGMKLVFKNKEYLANSYSLVVGMVALCKIMDAIPTEWKEMNLFQETNEYVYRRIKRIISKMTTSLVEQRKVFKSLNEIVLINEIPQLWFTYLSGAITRAETRLNTIETIIKEDLTMTPFILYLEWLKENETTFTKDIRAIISVDNFKEMFGGDYDAVHDVIYNHISSIILENQNNEELRQKAVDEAARYEKAVAARAEANKREKEEKKQQILTSKKEELKEIMYKVTGNLELMYKSKYTSSGLINISRRNGGIFYIVSVMKIPKKQYSIDRRVYYAGSSYIASDLKNAKKYKTKEDAEAACKTILTEHPDYIADITQVDLRRLCAEAEIGY